jgi:serine/threonine-protein kinase HipA
LHESGAKSPWPIGYQQLRVGKEGHVATLANVRSEAGRFMQHAQEAEALMEGVVQQMRDWQNVFAQAGVSQRDIEFCARYVLRGFADFTDK